MKQIEISGYSVALYYSKGVEQSSQAEENSNKDAADPEENAAAQVPPIVLVPGLGSGLTRTFYELEQIRNYKCRVLAYDRPAYGYSRPVPRRNPFANRDTDHLVQELKILLDKFAASPEGRSFRPPYLFVAGSMGGLVMQLYALRYPRDVAGIVFLDASTQDFYKPNDPFMRAGLKNAVFVYKVFKLMATLGILRLMIALKALPAELKTLYFKSMSDYMRPFGLADFCRPSTQQTFSDEFKGFEPGCEQTRAERNAKPQGFLLDVPIAVLTSMKWPKLMRQGWRDAQYNYLTTLSNDSFQILCPNNNHPELCTDEYK